VDYLKPRGAIGFYHPDWVVVQKMKAGEVNWIIETKGRVWEGTTAKDEAMRDWCERVSVLLLLACQRVRAFVQLTRSMMTPFFPFSNYATLPFRDKPSG